MDLNYLISDYTKVNLQLDGIYRISRPPGSKAVGKTTSEGVYGFVFPIKGRAKFTIYGIEYILEEGTILHAGSKMDLDKEVLGNENWEFILLHYRVLNEDHKTESNFNKHYIVKIFSDRNREIMQLLEQLLFLDREHSMNSLLRSKALLYEIIAKTFDFSSERIDCQQRHPMEEVLDFIHGNLDKNIVIAELAEKFGMNSKQFYYLFHKYVGISPKQYIVDVRIKRAKELLIEGDVAISDVAGLVGYEDPLHFSRIFKKNTGTSPTGFRSQFRKNPY